MTGLTRRLFNGKTGVIGAVVGVTAAGIAAGVAAERYLVRRSRRGEDPYADEPFGVLPFTESMTVTTDGGVDLYVEIVAPTEAADRGTAGAAVPGASGAAGRGAAKAAGRRGTEVAGRGTVEAAGRGTVEVAGRRSARRVGRRAKRSGEPTIIFVHGFCLDMGTFHFQRTGLAGRYRMVFFDQPGHGRSGRITKGEYTLERLADALRSVIEKTAPEGPIVLVGHSMGGMVIMAFAERWPELITERVAAVAFLSTSAGDMSEVSLGMPQVLTRLRKPLVPVVRTAGPIASAVVDRARHATTDLAWLMTRKYGFGTSQPSPALVSYVERMNSSTSLDVIARYLRTIYGHNRIMALAPLRRLPVLVLCGERDLVTPADHSREIAKALPDATLVVIPEGGHVTLLEHSDEVNAALEDLLAKAVGASPRER